MTDPDRACAEVPTEVFFPAYIGPGRLNDSNVARMVCGPCPVRDECLSYALTTRQRYGVWGGRTETERREILRRRYGAHPEMARRRPA